MNWAGIVVAVIAFAGLLAWDTVCYSWVHERQQRAEERHDEQIALLTRQIGILAAGQEALALYLRVQINPPIADDSPQAMEQAVDEPQPTEADTVEIPIVPVTTEPMALDVDPTPAVQARRDAAWDDPTQRPSPVPRHEPVFVERRVNIGGTVQTFRIPAPEGRAK